MPPRTAQRRRSSTLREHSCCRRRTGSRTNRGTDEPAFIELTFVIRQRLIISGRRLETDRAQQLIGSQGFNDHLRAGKTGDPRTDTRCRKVDVAQAHEFPQIICLVQGRYVARGHGCRIERRRDGDRQRKLCPVRSERKHLPRRCPGGNAGAPIEVCFDDLARGPTDFVGLSGHLLPPCPVRRAKYVGCLERAGH